MTRAKATAGAVPHARGRCETCAAVRACTGGRVRRCRWCLTGRGPWRGTEEYLGRLARVGVTVRAYQGARKASV